jgi:hypothetical protein
MLFERTKNRITLTNAAETSSSYLSHVTNWLDSDRCQKGAAVNGATAATWTKIARRNKIGVST